MISLKRKPYLLYPQSQDLCKMPTPRSILLVAELNTDLIPDVTGSVMLKLGYSTIDWEGMRSLIRGRRETGRFR